MRVHFRFKVFEPVVNPIRIHGETNYSPPFAVDLKICIDVELSCTISCLQVTVGSEELRSI
jgi:hypothetical protein